MAISSMTGFARADGELDGVAWHWELKSVNGKGLDVRCRMPPGHEMLEQALRTVAASQFRRGSLQVSLQVSRDLASTAFKINDEALQSVIAVASDLRGKLDAPPVSVEGLLALRGVIEIAEPEDTEDERQARHDKMLESFSEACAALAEMRRSEGAKMAEVISGQLDAIERLTGDARDCPARTADAIKARLADQIAKLLEASDSFDRDRLHQEAVLIAAKTDVQEELDRLFAHVEAARELLLAAEPVGRKFDFVAQEFNREANTLCSKSTDKSLTRIGLELKTVIDQLREQVQNIE